MLDDEIPALLTVEEAGRLLRIGRTKAYDLAQEWRATGGRSGLPVIDFGDLLRVPGPAIRRMLGVGLAPTSVVTRSGRPCAGLSTGTSESRPGAGHAGLTVEALVARGRVTPGPPRRRPARSRCSGPPEESPRPSRPLQPDLPAPPLRTPPGTLPIPNHPPAHEPALPDPHP